jgi:hypothetical protein
MAKKFVACMLIQHDGEKYQIDEVLDPSKFTKDELTRLYERGAFKVVDESELKAKKEENAKAFDDIVNNQTTTPEKKAEAAAAAKAAEEKRKEEAEKAATEKKAAEAPKK